MTWQELANFINNQMPECNRNQKVRVWNSGEDSTMDGGEFCDANNVTPFDDDEEPNPDNIYFISFNGDDSWR